MTALKSNTQTALSRQLTGVILGTAVGDAIGLPYEGMSRRRVVSWLGEPTKHRFLLGRGMVSDDTEHSCMVMQSLIAAQGDSDRFCRDLAKRFRWWFASLPAGIGKATARSILKLWVGCSPYRSGVFSAGNGPAMRSAVFGVAISDEAQMCEFVRLSTRITHSDPKAEYGALVVALLARLSSTGDLASPERVLHEIRRVLPSDADSDELIDLIRQAVVSAQSQDSTVEFAKEIGLEKAVTGYTYHTVPVAVHACLRYHDDFRTAIEQTILCGGDTDSVAAIVGGILGAGTSVDAIPQDWLNGLCEWPRSVTWMRELSMQLAESIEGDVPKKAPALLFPVVLLRNLFFLIVVLMHAARRVFPPY